MQKIKLILALTVFVCGMVQSQDLKRADAYFERAFYSDAIALYEELAKNNRSRNVVQNLADSYYNTYQLPQAAKWYAYLTSVYDENLDESYFFKYSQTLKSVGEYGEATEVLMDYYTRKGDTAKVEQLQKDLEYLENVNAIGDRFEMNSLALNTVFSEFGAAEIDSNLVYAAAEKKGIPVISKTYRWNNEGYLDLYAHPKGKLNLADSLSVGYSKQINTRMHEGTFAITKDRQTFYFTRNNFSKGKKRTNAKKVSYLKIYRADWDGEKWSNVKELPFNSDDFSNEHPTLSADEKTMYFASDRAGGLGSFDIYSVAIYNNGSYGEPKNLGPAINTERKEQFPFVDADDNLYFSSNGQPGFGLLDIFVAKKQNGNYQKADNVGKPLNTGFDDFAYTMNTDGKTGYFSSNRPDGKGADDIYALTITKPLEIKQCEQRIAGVVLDKTTKEPIAFSTVNLLAEDGTIIKTSTTGPDASFDFAVSCTSSFKVVGEKEGFTEDFKIITTDKVRDKTQETKLNLYADIDRYKEEARVLQEQLMEKERLEQKRIEREKLAEEERIAQEKEEEKQRIEAEKRAKEKAEEERKQRIEEAIAREPAIERDGERIIIKAEPKIYFDYDLWYIRLESKVTLDNIIRILKENPGIQLEVGTHTDIRGNDQYNEELSQKRSNSVFEYMTRNGVKASRVTAKGYGETQTIVQCKTEESCSEEQHELNRRCEFVITQWN